MATYKGKEGVLKSGANLIGELRSFELEITSNEVDTSTMGTDWTGVDSTQLSWRGTAEAFWDDQDTGQADLVVGNKVSLEFVPQGETTGNATFSGSALVTSVTRRQSHDNLIEAAFAFTGDGALTEGTVV